MCYLKNKKKDNKSKSTDDNDNKVFRQNHYNNMHKTVEQYKKHNVELQDKSKIYNFWLEREMQRHET